MLNFVRAAAITAFLPQTLRSLSSPRHHALHRHVCMGVKSRRALSLRPSVHSDGAKHELKADIRTKREVMEQPLVDASGKVYLKGLTLPQLEQWVEKDLGEKRFRARQLWQWMYKSERLAGDFNSMTDLAKSFRTRLLTCARADSLRIHRVHESTDGTKKVLYALDSGGYVESVIIPANGRTTVCVSSQSGCALNCQFCLTGRTGFKGHLTAGEIIDQVVMARRHFAPNASHVVFMGEGEPLHNVNNVLSAVEILLDNNGLNFSHNRITVSTSGLIPEIRRFVRESKANLAVSLHAADNATRSWLMPISRKYGVEELMAVLRDEFPRVEARQRKVFFEYVMLKGVNDSLANAKDLLRATAGVPCKINLIHFNTHQGSPFEASSDETIYAFQDYLVKKGMVVTVRTSRGSDQMAACGQLGILGAVQAPRMRVPEKFAHAVKEVQT